MNQFMKITVKLQKVFQLTTKEYRPVGVTNFLFFFLVKALLKYLSVKMLFGQKEIFEWEF